MEKDSLIAWDRLIRYVALDGTYRYGEPVLQNGDTDVGSLAAKGNLKVKILEGSSPLTAQRTQRVEDVKELLGPLEPKDVPIIRCIGLNYKSHILETGRALPTSPTVFIKPSPTIANHNEAIPIPQFAQSQCDYEGELTILIGRDGKDIPASSALDYVAGYTIGNDLTARDWQRDPSKAGPVPQWSFCKSFDKYAPLGPCLVSKHVLGDASGLELRTWVNGEERQRGNTSDLCFGVRELVAFCSKGQTLKKGSLIMTGTPGGVGLFMDPPTFLKDGDEVVVEIEGIGRLVNRIKFESRI